MQRQREVTSTGREMRVTTGQGRVLYRCRHDEATNPYVGGARELLTMPREQLTEGEMDSDADGSSMRVCAG
jgi:hypothetical protein